jgi:hypothetical protein
MKSNRQIVEAIKCRIREIENTPFGTHLTKSDAALIVREYEALLSWIRSTKRK